MNHGTVHCYQQGCRCDDCRMAERDRKRRYRASLREEGSGEMCIWCLQRFHRNPIPGATLMNHEKACPKR